MPEVRCLGQMDNSDGTFECVNRVYDKNGVAPTITTGGGQHTLKILDYEETPTVKIKENTVKGYSECELGGVANLSYPTSKTRRGRVESRGQIAPTLTVSGNEIHRIEGLYRIRKLTPRENWRLMGFTDEDFDKAQSVNSNCQLYKQAGNSICVPVLEAIFRQLF